MKKVIYYLPRILAICIVLFFGVFILEGFGNGFNWRDSVANLIVTVIIAGITLVAWKRPQIGSWFFIVLGLFFSFFFHPLFWIGFTIGGITFATGILFLFDSFTDETFKSKVKLTLYVILAVILVIILSYLAIFGRALTQSENHLAIALVLPEAIYRSEAVKIDDQKYLAKNITSFIKTMERQGFTYVEQMGSGYFFEKDNKHYISTSRMYSAYFMIFTNPTISDQISASAVNEPNIGFKSVYQENTVPLSGVPNYQAVKTKYGLAISADQEKFLEENRFLLIDSNQVPFFKSGINFDQWLLDSDSLGGGSIYDRKPEDAVLVTPDTVLHAYHKYFELTLEELEQHELNQALGDFLSGLYTNLAKASKNSQGEVKTRYQNLEAQIVLAKILFENKNVAKPSYFANPEDEEKYNNNDKTIDSLENAKKLLVKHSKDLTPSLIAAIKTDLTEIYAAQNIGASPLFKQYDEQVKTDYTQFTPRSHYTKNSTLRAYFRTMIYLGRSSYLLNSHLGLADTNLLVKQMALKSGSIAPLDAWNKISAITGFYAGQSDDLTYNEWKDFTTSTLGSGINSDKELISENNINKLTANLSKLRKPKILSDVIIDDNIASRDKADLLKQSLSFRVFGQKFSFDAWILNDLTAGQEKTEVKLPSTPSALFVAAAFGDQQAKNYSGEFLKQSADFNQAEVNSFFTKLAQKQTDINKVKESEWFGSLGSSWLYILGSLTHNYGQSYPLYMQAKSFLDKQIQTFLGSYTELKHDTLLYAKQSYAEMGAGGEDRPIPPVVKGFVEPNLEFWNRFNNLLDRTKQLFVDNKLFENHSALERLSQFKEISAVYAKIAEQELRGQTISDDDYEILRTTRLAFMAQPFEVIDPTETSGRTALIADIHTDIPKSQILYEATAKPYLMLAIVGNENSPRVVTGLVYNHYELTDKIGQRLTDENWRNRVYNDNSLLPAKNFWYKSLLVK